VRSIVLVALLLVAGCASHTYSLDYKVVVAEYKDAKPIGDRATVSDWDPSANAYRVWNSRISAGLHEPKRLALDETTRLVDNARVIVLVMFENGEGHSYALVEDPKAPGTYRFTIQNESGPTPVQRTMLMVEAPGQQTLASECGASISCHGWAKTHIALFGDEVALFPPSVSR
jgi:hypothetical protein